MEEFKKKFKSTQTKKGDGKENNYETSRPNTHHLIQNSTASTFLNKTFNKFQNTFNTKADTRIINRSPKDKELKQVRSALNIIPAFNSSSNNTRLSIKIENILHFNAKFLKDLKKDLNKSSQKHNSSALNILKVRK